MELPKKGDLFIWDGFGEADKRLKQGDLMVILGPAQPHIIKQSANLDLISVKDLDIVHRVYWGGSNGLVNYTTIHQYHLVKVGESCWTRQVKEGKCPIIEQMTEVK